MFNLEIKVRKMVHELIQPILYNISQENRLIHKLEIYCRENHEYYF